jgi:hypothetical protein
VLVGAVKGIGRAIGSLIAGFGSARRVDPTLRQDYDRALDAERRARLKQSWSASRKRKGE